MKYLIASVTFASLCCLASLATGQTVSSQYPSGQSYIISSSPTADGGVITTTYQPPHAGAGAQASTLPTVPISNSINPTVTQYRPLQANQVINNQPGTAPTFPAQYSTGISMPPSNTTNLQPTQFQPTQVQPTSPIATHGTPQTIQSTSGINPYVGMPLPQTYDGRVVAYSAPTNNPCATVPANIAPNLGYSAAPQTVPVNQNYRPVVPVRGLPGGSYVSQGLWGNPRAYVQGQPVRNFWRYVIF